MNVAIDGMDLTSHLPASPQIEVCLLNCSIINIRLSRNEMCCCCILILAASRFGTSATTNWQIHRHNWRHTCRGVVKCFLLFIIYKLNAHVAAHGIRDAILIKSWSTSRINRVGIYKIRQCALKHVNYQILLLRFHWRLHLPVQRDCFPLDFSSRLLLLASWSQLC